MSHRMYGREIRRPFFLISRTAIIARISMPDEMGVGKAKLPKKAVYVGAGLAGGILAYAYYRKRRGGKSTTASNTTAKYPNSIDPPTGSTDTEEHSMANATYGIFKI